MATFTFKFEEDTELTGYMKLRLWVEAEGVGRYGLICYSPKVGRERKVHPVCH